MARDRWHRALWVAVKVSDFFQGIDRKLLAGPQFRGSQKFGCEDLIPAMETQVHATDSQPPFPWISLPRTLPREQLEIGTLASFCSWLSGFLWGSYCSESCHGPQDCEGQCCPDLLIQPSCFRDVQTEVGRRSEVCSSHRAL